jgi:hypothetical protein
MFPLYTFGYSDKQHNELLVLAEQLDVIVADIRFNPRSRVPQWNGDRLAAEAIAARYRMSVTHL